MARRACLEAGRGLEDLEVERRQERRLRAGSDRSLDRLDDRVDDSTLIA
jgi:hypothetical protein